MSSEIIVEGKYNSAKIFTEVVDEACISQVIGFLNQEFIQGEQVRIMPDCHAGKGSVIGTTMTLTDKVVPNIVGVDIGCGVLAVKLADVGELSNDTLEKLDKIIKRFIPAGREVNESESKFDNGSIKYSEVRAPFNEHRAKLALGSLGGGNHFIELNFSETEKCYYLCIHTGSRSLGKEIATYYQNQAVKYHSDKRSEIEKLIKDLKASGQHALIQEKIQEFKLKNNTKIPKELAYVEGPLFDDYLNDLKIAQKYAAVNRLIIANRITIAMEWKTVERFDSIHNYIDIDNKILRKGAISAQAGEKIIIPINMRDGSIIAVGKGNSDWNYSAPHGAGRLLSRTKAKEQLSLNDFVETMSDVYSTTVGQNTLDEAPDAYKSIDDIVLNISDTAEIIDIVRPVYNFKGIE